MPQLSDYQQSILAHLAKYKACPYSFANLRSLKILEAKGLIRWYPYSKINSLDGAWKPLILR